MRVLGWLMLIVAIALSVNLFAAREFLLGRASSAVSAELSHEALKFRTFADQARDPVTGRRYATVPQLLDGYLAEVVPEEDEAMFSVVDGRPRHRTRGDAPARLDQMPAVVSRVAAAREPFTASVPLARGQAVYTAIPVKVDGRAGSGALVVVEFTGEDQARVASTVRLIGLVSVLALVLAAVVSWFVAGRVLAPVRQVRRTAEAIGESDLSRRIPTPATSASDDVSLLATTFNRMLDRIEHAFSSQRDFMDDAAHELRTPLTVIRGHLELMDGDESPQERAATSALLLDELGRMNRIVDDMLLLAKSERPDFLEPGPVDLTDLAVSVVAKASSIAPRAWTVGRSSEDTVLGDGQRLTQALVQLAANAADHTEAGDPISVAAYRHGDQVVLTVEDSGPGVPPELRASLFDRFRRGDDARHEGAGLGLAIVRSIARAHGGEAHIGDSALGGAVFSLVFPAVPPGPEAPPPGGPPSQGRVRPGELGLAGS